MTDPEPWFQVPRWLVDEADLTATELMVVIALLRHDGPGGSIHPGYTRIARCARITRRAAINTIAALEKRGIVEIVRTPHRSNTYRLSLGSARKVVNEVHQGSEPSSPVVVTPVHPSGEPSSPGLVNVVHQSGEPGSPELVNVVHQGSERSSPKVVNEVHPKEIHRKRHIEGEGAANAHTAATDTLDTPPPRRCPAHLDHPNPPRCGPCADARRAHDAWTKDRDTRAAALAEAAAEREAAEREAAIARQQDEIAACTRCDDRGIELHRLVVCNHKEPAHTRNGIEAAKAAFAAAITQKDDDDQP